MCSLFVLFCFSDTNTPRPFSTDTIGASQSFPLPAAPQERMVALLFRRQWWCSRSGANGGAPVPAPANVGPSIPPLSHQSPIQSICPIQPVANQTSHKSQFFLANPRPITIRSSQYYPSDTIQTIRSKIYDPEDPADKIQTIQPIRSSQYDPASVSSEGNPPTRPSLIRKTHPQLLQLLIFHPPQRPLPPDIFSGPLPFHLLLPSLLQIEIAPFPRPFLAFLIASPTGQSLEETLKCLMDPHRYRFC